MATIFNTQVLVPRIKLGSQGLEVSKQGLGCVGMSSVYCPPKPEVEMMKVLHHAMELGVTFFDTSDFYGPYTNESLIGKALRGVTREKMQIATKFGIKLKDGKLEIRGDPNNVKASCEASLKRLGVDYIDLYYIHRIDTNTPIEITIEAMQKCMDEGKVKHIGLSEASSQTIRRAHAVHPITAVQNEWSLWSRDSESDIVGTCRELGIGIVPYSPLGRGFFAAGPKMFHNMSNDDFRKGFPRFKPENLEQNKKIFDQVSKMASRKGCTPSQLALAWIHSQGKDVCPIPGTTKIENLNQNLGALLVELTMEEMVELESWASPDFVKGDRHTFMSSTWINSETPPLQNKKLEYHHHA